jgi:hypothetical protein
MLNCVHSTCVSQAIFCENMNGTLATFTKTKTKLDFYVPLVNSSFWTHEGEDTNRHVFWQSFEWNGGVVEEIKVSFLEKHLMVAWEHWCIWPSVIVEGEVSCDVDSGFFRTHFGYILKTSIWKQAKELHKPSPTCFVKPHNQQRHCGHFTYCIIL